MPPVRRPKEVPLQLATGGGAIRTHKGGGRCKDPVRVSFPPHAPRERCLFFFCAGVDFFWKLASPFVLSDLAAVHFRELLRGVIRAHKGRVVLGDIRTQEVHRKLTSPGLPAELGFMDKWGSRCPHRLGRTT